MSDEYLLHFPSFRKIVIKIGKKKRKPESSEEEESDEDPPSRHASKDDDAVSSSTHTHTLHVHWCYSSWACNAYNRVRFIWLDQLTLNKVTVDLLYAGLRLHVFFKSSQSYVLVVTILLWDAVPFPVFTRQQVASSLLILLLSWKPSWLWL